MAPQPTRFATGPDDGGTFGVRSTWYRWARESWSPCRLCRIPLWRPARFRFPTKTPAISPPLPAPLVTARASGASAGRTARSARYGSAERISYPRPKPPPSSKPATAANPTRCSGRSLRRDPAVDDEAGAGHEGGVVRSEKDDALSDVGDRAHAADRDACQRLLARRLEVVGAEIAGPHRQHLVAHVGLGRARVHRVDADAVALAGEFERRRFGEQGDPALGHRIERVAGRADEPRYRGQIDDRAAVGALLCALAQCRQRE